MKNTATRGDQLIPK